MDLNVLSSLSSILGVTVLPWHLLVAIVVCPLLYIALYVLMYRNKPQLPRGYEPIVGNRSTVEEKRPDMVRDNFAVKKVPKEIDYIVVGSGIGGMCCASLLARTGKRVLVLEQHYIAGGCCHTFDEHGYEFDTGLHYLGDPSKLNAILGVINPEYPIEWAQMGTEEDGHVFDVIDHGNERFEFKEGIEVVRKDLKERFPEEEKAIDRYFEETEIVRSVFDPAANFKLLPSWLCRLIAPFALRKFLKRAALSSYAFVDSITDNEELKALLLAQAGDIGGPPDESCHVLLTSVLTYYAKKGGYYPVGGPLELVRALIQPIEKAGGRVLVRAHVEQVLFNEAQDTAIGVKMKKGVKIFAKCGVICNANFRAILNRLMDRSPQAIERWGIRSLVDRIAPSTGHNYVFFGFNKPQEELKLPSSNMWYMPCLKNYGFDMNAASRVAANHVYEPEFKDKSYFIGFPSSKDPNYSKRYPGKSVGVMLTEANYNSVKKWSEKTQGRRGADYEKLKAELAAHARAKMIELFPQTADCIDFIEVATPITNNYYLATTRGESYGLSAPPTRFLEWEKLRPDTNIGKFWVTGQDVLTMGVYPSFIAGMFTAFRVLGYPTLMDLLCNRNLIADIHSLAKREKKDV